MSESFKAREVPWVGGAMAVPLLLTLRPFDEPDLFWHLAVGRHIAEQGELPRQNLWSFTAPEHPFAATSWLFDWMLYRLEQAAGFPGVHWATAVLAALAFGGVYIAARRLGSNRGVALGLTSIAAVASQFRLMPRPQVVSYLMLALTVHLLISAYRTERRWPCFLLPPLIALWSNFHAGAVFGVGAVGCWAVATALEAMESRKASGSETKGWRPVLWAGFTAVACGLAFLANPFGLETVRYSLFHLKQVDQVVELSEFTVPNPKVHSVFWALWGMSGCLAVVSLRSLSLRPRRWLGPMLILAFGVLSVRAVRVVPKFLIVAIPAAAAEVSMLLAAWKRRPGWGRWVVPEAVVVGLSAMALALAATPNARRELVRGPSVGIDPYRLPEAMARFAEEKGIAGRCFASWDVSGFVEWRLPQSPVFIDPRLRAYPPELFQALEKADDDQAEFDGLMNRYGVEWAFRGHSYLRLSGIGHFLPVEWAVVYWDETGQLLLRRSVERFRPLIEQEELKELLPSSDPIASFRTLQGERRARWVSELERTAGRSPRVVAAQVGLCLERARLSHFESAADACERAIEAVSMRERDSAGSTEKSRNQVAIALTLLGDQSRRSGQREAARGAYSLALEQVPKFEGALAGLQAL